MLNGTNIAIDARFWRPTGVATYTYNLVTALKTVRNGVRLHGIVAAQNASLYSPLCDSVTIVSAPGYSLREHLAVPAAASGCDLLHVPHYNVPAFYSGKLVVSIHDVIHLTSARTWAALGYASVMLRMAAWKADIVITVSDYSRDEIIRSLGVSRSKIVVIPHGVSSRFRALPHEEALAIVAKELGRARPYFLCVSGGLRPHKNVPRLLHAAALFWSQTNAGCDLIIVGDRPEEKARLLELSTRLGISERVVFVSQVSEELLPFLYAGAEFVVVPSLVEGFGLPVLEAMACGAPVVCSRTSSLPEVGKEAALYFDPIDPSDMCSVMSAITQSPDLRCELREKGLKRAAEFSWQESARRHLEVYSAVTAN